VSETLMLVVNQLGGTQLVTSNCMHSSSKRSVDNV